MTDPDERIINRAIAHLDKTTVENTQQGDLQDIREEARAALHRLFRDRRRLEKDIKELQDRCVWYETQMDELARLRGEIQDMANEHNGGWVPRMEYDRLREENESLSWRVGEQANEIARLREELEAAVDAGNKALSENASLRADLRESLDREREYEAELARLCEENDNFINGAEEALGWRDERDRLREKTEVQAEMLEQSYKELARLREKVAMLEDELKEDLGTKENVRLREANALLAQTVTAQGVENERLKEEYRVLYQDRERLREQVKWLGPERKGQS